MAKLMGYWEAANVREPVYIEFYSAVNGKSFILECRLIRIESDMLVYVDDTEYGHGCLKSDYNVWTVFGWRPWSEKPTEQEMVGTPWRERRI